MTPAQIIWTVLIAAQAVVNVPFILTLVKGTSMSEAFKTALAALVAKFTDKLTAMQGELDAANAQASTLQSQLDTLDAEATAAVVAATPQ